MASAGKKEQKRISFLMPYIDFCFMLIIIFVSMLSIAYFEPLGTTDIEAKRETKIDIRQGENPVLPPGIQLQKKGKGDEPGAGTVHILTTPNTSRPGAAGPNPAAPPPDVDVEKMKKDLAEKEKKLKELEEELEKKKDKVGKSDHLYIDLGEE